MDHQEILSIVQNVFKFLCMLLFTDYLSGFDKMFQVADTYNTCTKYTIWSFNYILILSYANNRHADQSLKIGYTDP